MVIERTPTNARFVGSMDDSSSESTITTPLPSSAMRSGSNHRFDAEVYLRHADRLWEAEVTNADRYARQVRLLITLCATFIGAILYRASLEPAGELMGNMDRWQRICCLTTIALAVLFVALGIGRTTPAALPSWRAKAARWTWFLAAVALIAIGSRVGQWWVLGSLSAVSLMVATFCFVSALYALLRPPADVAPRPRHSQTDALPCAVAPDTGDERRSAYEQPKGAPSSSLLILTERRKRYVQQTLSHAEVAVFARVYDAGLNLQERNLRFRDCIRGAQRLIGLGIVFSLIAVIALIVVAILS